MQRLLNRSTWDPDGVRDDLRGYVAEHLGDPDGVLLVRDQDRVPVSEPANYLSPKIVADRVGVPHRTVQ